jgi:hypothetical protein
MIEHEFGARFIKARAEPELRPGDAACSLARGRAMSLEALHGCSVDRRSTA